jgi:hypothetical protein
MEYNAYFFFTYGFSPNSCQAGLRTGPGPGQTQTAKTAFILKPLEYQEVF